LLKMSVTATTETSKPFLTLESQLDQNFPLLSVLSPFFNINVASINATSSSGTDS